MTSVIEPPGVSRARWRRSAQPCESPPAPLRPSGSGPLVARLRPTGSPRLAPAPPQSMSGMRLEPPFPVRPGATPELRAGLSARARQGGWQSAWSADPERLRRTPWPGPPWLRRSRRAARRVVSFAAVQAPLAGARRCPAVDRRACGYSRLEEACHWTVPAGSCAEINAIRLPEVTGDANRRPFARSRSVPSYRARPRAPPSASRTMMSSIRRSTGAQSSV